MLYEEYEKGTGVHSSQEYDMANALYSAMPDTFTKQKMYDLRNSMDADDFKALCVLALNNHETLEEQEKKIFKLEQYKGFVDNVLTVLKDECKINAIEVYTAHMADKASRCEKERIEARWKELQEKP